ncbi:MAG: hypothetical protein KGJ00_06840 [Bradyrhizobium sp.]|uniref:hypothetical protein n=1 Tax=Bradyrhizobium sp. TaxID=376 RepID=UPI0023A01B5F|nr:hypothetical protein [Bradyrhizobium sp.]MDE2062109.1 hypothetical protein [Bradyrhizobium sp.]
MDLPVQRLVFLLHLLERFHGRIATRLRRLSFGGQFGLLPLIAGFALCLSLDEPALFHCSRGSNAHHQPGASHKGGEREGETFRSDGDHALLSYSAAVLPTVVMPIFDSKKCQPGALYSPDPPEIRLEIHIHRKTCVPPEKPDEGV